MVRLAGETGHAGAEGATAPETLRHNGPQGKLNSGKQRDGLALTEGVTALRGNLSGTATEGA